MQRTQIDPSERPIINTYGLTKTFGKLVAVNNINLEVMRGDVFGFLGPNGSGKTTTIRMLLGLLRPSAGSIRLFGMDLPTHQQEILPRIGAITAAPRRHEHSCGCLLLARRRERLVEHE